MHVLDLIEVQQPSETFSKIIKSTNQYLRRNKGAAADFDILKNVASLYRESVRATDLVARYGGEEFVVLLPHTDVASGRALAERIRKAVAAEPVSFGEKGAVTITASIGIASVLPVDEDDLKTVGDSLLARADVALYRAKAAGRNRVEAATG